jgi:hypothetical protein
MINIQNPPQLLRYPDYRIQVGEASVNFQGRICAEDFVTVSHDMMADIITRPYPILSPAKAGITGQSRDHRPSRMQAGISTTASECQTWITATRAGVQPQIIAV